MLLATALPAHAASPLVPDLIQSFENTSGSQSDEWGAATAIDGGYAVVGAPGVGNGRAFVYARQRTAGQEDRWVLEATLESGEATITTFGSAVAISGQTIAVGSRHTRGGLYVFERDATTGTWPRRHAFNDNTLEMLIGSSIAIDGDVMVAGNENITSVNLPGEAWVYRRGASGWARETVLKGSAYEYDDHSGTAVDVEGGTIVFGAPDLFDSETNELGSIFVFRHNGSQWTEVQRIRARNLAERRIGRSLRLDQDRLASISSGRNPDTGFSGQALQVFERQPGTVGGWTLAQTVWPSDIAGASEIFGMLAFEDGLLVVNGRTAANFDTEVYALERRSDPFGGGFWSPAHTGSLADPAPTGLGVTGAVGDFSEGVMLMGFPRWTRSGLPRDVGAHYFARLLPHPDAPDFVGFPANGVEATEGEMFSLAVRAEGPVGGNVAVTAEGLPGWLSFAPDGSGGGTLSGTPGPGDTGSTKVTFAAETSPGGLRTRQTLQLSVLPAGSPPVIAAFSASRMEVPAGDPVTLHWRVLGADSIILGPGGETLAGGEGLLEVRPRRSTTYVLETVNVHGVTRAEVRINVPLFGAPIRIDSPGMFLNASAAADYDGDGDLDVLAILRGPNRFGWFENTGGSFAPPVTFQTGFNSPIADSEVLARDMDGDGDTDVLYPEFGNLWYFRSLGKGAGFAPAVSIYSAQFPSPLRVTDVDGDAQLDVVLVVDEARIVWLRQNNGSFSLSGTNLTATSVNSIAISDIDRDGRDDIVFTRWNGGGSNIHLGWLRNLGGRFSSPIYIESPAQDTRLVETGDLDGDGVPDVLTAGFNSDIIAWRRNLGNGGFGPRVQITNRTDTPTDLLAADLDGDGDLDVAVTSDSDSEVSWFENLGGGKFGGQQIITTVVERPEWLQAADVDGDGDLDLVTRGEEGVYWIENENDPPARGDFPPLRLIEDSPAVELDLGPFFDDPQDPDEDLVYAVVGITGDPLLAAAALSADGRRLVVTPARDAFGTARVLVRATDPRGLFGEVELPVEVTELVNLALQVTRDRAVAGAPDVVVHRVEISNSGPSNATALRIDVLPDLPAGVSPASAIPSAGTYSEGLWDIPVLPEGGSASLVMSYTVSDQANGGVDSVKTSATLQAVAQPQAAPGGLSASAATSIVSPQQVPVGVVAKPTLERQSGLFTQVITIRNDNPLAVSSVRVVVLGLPPGARVQNAHGTTAENLPYVDSLTDLPPGGQTTLTLEFYIPNRVTFVPAYRAVAVLTTDPPAPEPAESAPAPDRMMVLPGGSFLIEFPSVVGRRYAIEYSSDMNTWQRVVSTITAAADRTQWIDSGPPKTSSHPASVPRRYYRFVTLPE